MSTRKRRNRKPNNNKAIVSHQALISGQAFEESAEELLFKPIVYKTSSVDRTVDFENSNSVKYDIEKSRMRDARMMVETKAKDAAAEMMMEFISSIIEEESPDKEEQTGE